MAGVELNFETLQAILTPVDGLTDKLTLKLPSEINEAVLGLAETAGFPEDQLRYVIGLFLAYPLGIIFSALPNPTLKHLMSFTVGLAMFMLVLGNTWIHSMITSVVTYVIVKYGPPRMAPYMASLFLMAYLSFGHLYRIYVDYMGWTLDFTGPQMILTIKLMSFAFNYYDGVVDIDTINSYPDDKNLARVYASRRKLSVTKMPSLLEYFGYCYNFSTLLAGPSFEFREYIDTVNGVKFYRFGKKASMPPRILAGLARMLTGLICMGIFVAFSSNYNVPMLYSAKTLIQPFWYRVAFAWFTLLIVRMKYYFAWKVAEGGCIFAGFGFEGYDRDGNPLGWGGVDNMDIIGFETAQSIRDGSRAWNKGTQSWLERYVYSRTNNSLIATYFCSAFWHGFYPGYYMFFMSVPLATAVNRELYRRVRPWFLNPDGTDGPLKSVYNLVGIIATSLTMNYLVMPFQVLAWEYTSIVLLSYYYCGHVILILTYLATKCVPRRKTKHVDMANGGARSRKSVKVE